MIFWIFILLTVVGLALVFINEIKSYYNMYIDVAGWSLFVISGLVSATMFCFIIGSRCLASGTKAAMSEKYSALVYKVQTETCRDEFGIVNKDFIDEIQEWNVELAKKQCYQRDFWIGIFYPDIYDNFQTIDLNQIAYKED